MLYYNHANNKKCVQKVGELLNKHEIAIDVFNKVGSIAKTADFVAVGLKNYDVVSLCNQGYIERIRNGFYKLPNAEEPKEEALISKLLPQGIVCVESALFYYGYSDFAPREWTVAVPRSFSRAIKAMQEVPVKAYYVQNEFYHYGATVGDFNGVELKVYDRERTICDCLRANYEDFRKTDPYFSRLSSESEGMDFYEIEIATVGIIGDIQRENAIFILPLNK